MEEEKNVVEEKEYVLGAEAVAELRELNGKISVMCAQLGNLERVIHKYEIQKQAMLQQIESVESKINDMTGAIAKTYGLDKECNYTVDWDTGKLMKV